MGETTKGRGFEDEGIRVGAAGSRGSNFIQGQKEIKASEFKVGTLIGLKQNY